MLPTGSPAKGLVSIFKIMEEFLQWTILIHQSLVSLLRDILELSIKSKAEQSVSYRGGGGSVWIEHAWLPVGVCWTVPAECGGSQSSSRSLLAWTQRQGPCQFRTSPPQGWEGGRCNTSLQSHFQSRYSFSMRAGIGFIQGYGIKQFLSLIFFIVVKMCRAWLNVWP